MSGSNNLKRVLAVERILQQAPNGITIKQITEKLDRDYGLKAERKSLYNIIAELSDFAPISKRKKDYNTFYYLESYAVPVAQHQIEEASQDVVSKKEYEALKEKHKKEIQHIRDTYNLKFKTAKSEVAQLKKVIEKNSFEDVPPVEKSVPKRKHYPKSNKVIQECPFFIASGGQYILCEGIINGTKTKHIFATVNEKNGYEKLVCSSNCGKNCVHYKRVNELYEKRLR